MRRRFEVREHKMHNAEATIERRPNKLLKKQVPKEGNSASDLAFVNR